MKLKTKRLIIAGVLIIIAPLVLIHSIKEYQDVSNVNDWPHVKGFIVFSRIQKHEDFKRNNANRGTFSPISTTNYIHKMEYSYEVDGADYIGKNFNFSLTTATGISFVNKKDAIEQAKKFPKGKAIEVYYNPVKPIISSLSNTSASIGRILTAILFLAFAIVAMLIALEKINPKNLPWRRN